MNKINTNAYIGKSRFFQCADSIRHSSMGCVGYPPHVMTKLKKDENLASLIWANKVFYAKGLKDVWHSQNWTISSSKKEHGKKII